ncbi:hypothetical protein HG535_0H04330 [Zygotorulaspora mrakii]|uniref:Allantoin permease n=1 Tax=Zygotorulaspora mrakii TaxID=42260 RepID=A0A7H9B9Q1_ZYGMR|nr:uncharacterized protein HG535_0H04330 [Zygotorulaspora mrakii]QLG75106.1 hypothetical protein HG535_0H04330 [Zygotorulaspora mrakii]
MSTLNTDMGAKQQIKVVLTSENDVSDTESYRTGRYDSTKCEKIMRSLQLGGAVNSRRSNADLDPVPPSRRTWGTHNFAMYWISDDFSLSMFESASSLMEVGLSWKMAIACVTIAQFITSLPIVANGLVGSKYRIGFAIQSRAVFGWHLSKLIIVMRMIVSIFWYAIQAYNGASCIYAMTVAIWPSFRTMRNQLPESSDTSTQMMICFFIYFVVVIPFFFVPMHKLKHFFTLKTIVTPIVAFGIMGWCIQAVKNQGMYDALWIDDTATASGSNRSWLFLSGLYSNIGTWATMGVNSPDFTRYAKRNSSQYITVFVMPCMACLMTFLGVVTARASRVLYGTMMWSPMLLVNQWTSSGGRAAAFFCAVAWLIAQIGVNIAGNSVAAANDMNSLWPKYINIRRGQIITAVIGSYALVPWKIMESGQSFLSFMSGYTIWLGPITGILICDFFFIHKCKYNVWEMYKPKGIYRYGKLGINWCAFVAFTIGWVPLLPGLLPSVSSSYSMPEGVNHLYALGYFYGVLAPGVVYVTLWKLFPNRAALSQVPVYCDDTEYKDYPEDYEPY